MMKMTGIVLAGGRNSRMGTNKAFLEINGVRLIDRTVNILRDIFEEIIVVSNTPLSYLPQDVTVVMDCFPECGALGGLHAGLFFASHPHAFICACDMPFLEGGFIKYMTTLAGDYDIVVPDSGDGLQPLHALYGRKCLPVITRQLEMHNLKIKAFYKGLKVLTVDEDTINSFPVGKKVFLNVNSREDLDRIYANFHAKQRL